MTSKERKDLYNDLLDLFEEAFDNPNKVSFICRELCDFVANCENEKYKEGFKDGVNSK